MIEPGRRLVTWFTALVIVGFSLLALYHFWNQGRFRHDAALHQELQAATLPEDQRPVRPGDWPGWRGPLRDGVSRETGLLTAWPEQGPKVLWQTPMSTGYSSMVVADGRLYTMQRRGDNEQVLCLDAKTGKEHWAYSTPVQYSNEYGGGPRSTPMVDGDRVYTVGVTGILTCLDTQTGKKVWDHDLLREFNAKNLTWGVSFAPLVDGNLVFVMPGGPDGGSLAAFDKKDGKLVWKSQDDRPGYSAPNAATLAGVRQVLFFTGVALVSADPETGKFLWRWPWPTSHDCNVATPIVRGDYVFIASGYGKGCAMLKVVKDGDGLKVERVYEHNNFCDHHSGSVLVGEHIYGFNEATLTCLDFRSGDVVWKKNGFGKGTLLAADGHLIVLGENGKLALIEATPERFREKSSFRFSSQRCWTLPVLSDGRLYVRDEEKLVCYDVKNP